MNMYTHYVYMHVHTKHACGYTVVDLGGLGGAIAPFLQPQGIQKNQCSDMKMH